MPMRTPFEKGQVFVAADPRDEGRRLIVLRLPVGYSLNYGGSPYVATIDDRTGKHLRPRYVSGNQFHDDAITQQGRPRVSGYILESAL